MSSQYLRKNRQGGLVQFIFIVIVIIIVLAVLKIDLRGQVNDDFEAAIKSSATLVWNGVKGPATTFWNEYFLPFVKGDFLTELEERRNERTNVEE